MIIRPLFDLIQEIDKRDIPLPPANGIDAVALFDKIRGKGRVRAAKDGYDIFMPAFYGFIHLQVVVVNSGGNTVCD